MRDARPFAMALAALLSACGGPLVGGGADAGADGTTPAPEAEGDAGDAGDAHAVVEDSGPPVGPVGDAGFDGGSVQRGAWVAFVSQRRGDSDIFLVHPDGTGVTPLVVAPGAQTHPTWTPDGAAVIFTWTEPNGLPSLRRIELASGVVSAIPTPGMRFAMLPCVSPDGTRLVFGGSDGTIPVGMRLYVMPVGGGTPRALTTTSSFDTRPVWAANGLIYFVSNRAANGDKFDLWSVDPDATPVTPVQITTAGDVTAGLASAQNGTLLAYGRRAGQSSELVLKNLSDGGIRTLAQYPDVGRPSLSPSGDAVTFPTRAFAAGKPYDLAFVRIDTPAAAIRLTDDPATDEDPALQP